jgi:hypothetical protein
MTRCASTSLVAKAICFAVVCGCGVHAGTSQATELRAGFLRQCPTTNFPSEDTPQIEAAQILGTIGLAFAGKVVDAGVEWLARTLNPEAASLQRDFLLQGLYRYRIKRGTETKDQIIPNPDMACLVVIAGDFSSQDASLSLPFTPDSQRTDAATRVSESFGIRKAPTLYFEAVRQFSLDKTAVTWRPVRLFVGEYLASGFFSGSSRGLSIEFGLYSPGQQQAFFSQKFEFDRVEKPFSRSSSELSVFGLVQPGAWGNLKAPSKTEQNITDSKSGAEIKPTTVGTQFDPFTLRVRVVESPKPYKIAQMFASAVQEKKGDIKSAVELALSPDKQKEAEFKSESQTIDAVKAYLGALEVAAKDCKPAAAKFTDTELLKCRLSIDTASLARDKADRACSAEKVSACDSMPIAPSVPQQ